MTMHPGLSHSPRTNWGFPIAATTISHSLRILSISLVLEWIRVTVAFASWRRWNIGIPTMLLLPITAALIPEISGATVFIRCKQPRGVQEIDLGVFPLITKSATFPGWSPSASLSLLTSLRTLSSSMWLGRGSCTRIPLTSGSAFSSLTNSMTSASVASEEKSLAV